MVYISSQNFSLSMRQSVLQTESNLAIAQKEVSSGVYADIGLQLGGQTGTAISLAQQSDQMTALTTNNNLATARLSATSSAITNIMANAQAVSNSLLSNASSGITETLQTEAGANLQSLIGSLNTSVAGQFVFAGTNTAVVPMASYASNRSAVDTALNTDLPDLTNNPANITGSQMQSYLNDPTTQFSALYQTGSNWSALSSASTKTLSSQISPSESTTTSVTASQSAFQSIAQAYSMLSELGGKNLSTDATNAVISKATALLNAGLTNLTTIQAAVGISQNSITDANSQMAAQQTILTENVSNLQEVDTYTLSTKVTALQTQLNDAYSLTSQLKSLSLVNYLTGG